MWSVCGNKQGKTFTEMIARRLGGVCDITEVTKTSAHFLIYSPCIRKPW